MRVAYVSIGDPRDPHYWSGIPYSILKHLERRGAEIDLIAPLDRSFRGLYIGHKLLYRALGRVFWVDRQPLALAWYAAQIKRRLRRSRADVVFAPSSVPVSLLSCDRPIVFWTDTTPDGMIGYYPGDFSRLAGLTKRNGHRQEQSALTRCSRAVFSSAWAAEAAVRGHRIDPAKVAVIAFGPTLAINHDEAAVRRFVADRLRLPHRLLFIGVDWERKGGPLAVAATARLNAMGQPTVLTIVGCDPFQTTPPPPFVEVVGFLDLGSDWGRGRLTDLLRGSHILLVPSRAEAMGVVFVEAAAFGLPVIATATGGIPSVVRHGVTGVLLGLPADVDELAAAIRQLCSDPGRYRAMALAAYTEYRARLGWDVAIDRLWSVLAGVVRV